MGLLNFILLATCIFVVVLGIKLVMGLLLFNFASQRYIKSCSRHRKFQQPRLPDSDFMGRKFQRAWGNRIRRQNENETR